MSLMTANVEVRSGSDADLDALVAAMWQRDHFTDRLACQQDRRGVLLVAWLDGRPVGNGSLSWLPADHPEIRRHLLDVPELGHLEVIGPLWGQGIGTALIRAAAATARQFGHDRLILAVGVDNPNARRLYERLGYVDWDHGTIVGTWVERDHDGPPVTLSETCHVLVKRL